MSKVLPLTDNKIKYFRPQDKEYKVADGSGLYLHVKTSGDKRWVYRYKFNGKPSSKAIW